MGALKPKTSSATATSSGSQQQKDQTTSTQSQSYDSSGSSTTTPILSGNQQAAWDSALTGATGYVGSGGTAAYDGNLQGAQSDQSQQALSGVMGMAGSDAARSIGTNGVDLATGLLRNNGLSGDMNTYLKSLQDTANGTNLNAVNPYLQQQLDAMSEQISNRVNGAMSGAGRYGSGAHTGVMTRELGNAIGNVLSTNWENERNRQLSAASTLQDVYGQGLNRASNLALNGSQITDQLYSPYEKMMAVGDYYDNRNQGAADAAAQKYLMNRDLKWTDLQNLAGIVGASPTGQQTNTSESGSSSSKSATNSTSNIKTKGTQITPTTKQSGLTTGLGLGLTGLGLLSKSDRRAKTDIKRIGTAWNGLPLYVFRYKDGGPMQTGVMAQDVERVKPGAVHDIDGVLHVDYALAFEDE